MRRAAVVSIAFAVTLATIVSMESQPGPIFADLAETFAVATLVGVLAWAARGAMRNALVVMCSLLVGLSIIDGGRLAFGITPTVKPAGASFDSGLSTARPVTGWGPSKPGQFRVVKTSPDGTFVYDVRVTIDAHLDRKTIPSAGHGAIVFFGDSFVFGEGLNDQDTLPQRFADLNHGKIPVANLAFSGWSPAQNLAALQSDLYRPLLSTPRRFILFTTAFHVDRTACKDFWSMSQSPRYALVDGRVVEQGQCSTKVMTLMSHFARRFALYDLFVGGVSGTTRQDVLLYLKIVDTFVATAKQHYGVGTTILFKPTGDYFLQGTGFTEATLIAALRKSGADVLVEVPPPPADAALYEIKGDGHPNGRANEAIARQIEAHLRTVDPASLATSDEATLRH